MSKNLLLLLLFLVIFFGIVIFRNYNDDDDDAETFKYNSNISNISTNIDYNPCVLGCLAYLHSNTVSDKSSPIGIWVKKQGNDTDTLTINQDGNVTYNTQIGLNSQNTGFYSNNKLTINELGQTYQVDNPVNNVLNVIGLDSFNRMENSFYGQTPICNNNDMVIVNNGGNISSPNMSSNCKWGLMQCVLTQCCNSQCGQCPGNEDNPNMPVPTPKDNYLTGIYDLSYFFPI